jgi:AcrR family transcriptional regulator
MARATAGGESASNKEDRIVDVAFGLFAARGFDGVSMSDIAEGARLTKATLYHYFPGKDAIFAAILKHQSFNADRVRAMFHASGQPLQEQLVDVAVRYLTVLSEPPRITQIVLRSNGDSPGILKVKQMLVRHLAERETAIRDRLAEELGSAAARAPVAEAAIAFCHSLTSLWLVEDALTGIPMTLARRKELARAMTRQCLASVGLPYASQIEKQNKRRKQ